LLSHLCDGHEESRVNRASAQLLPQLDGYAQKREADVSLPIIISRIMNKTLGYKQIPTKTWFLKFEGTLPDISSFEEHFQLRLWKNPDVESYLDLYKKVGNNWGWTGRLLKSHEELTEILQAKNNEVWLFQVKGEVAGFFEFVRSELETEIVYLGLKPEWIGKGLGHKLIRAAISKAGQNGGKVWLHTCERDHASALQAYLKAGFRIEKEIRSLEYYPE
jgi:ribosomal protein S18 acetylase RimI-like enzyme